MESITAPYIVPHNHPYIKLIAALVISASQPCSYLHSIQVAGIVMCDVQGVSCNGFHTFYHCHLYIRFDFYENFLLHICALILLIAKIGQSFFYCAGPRLLSII